MRYGLAICKDMHFAAFGRRYGCPNADAMRVPSWDFSYPDAWLGARMTATHGVENGYAVVRAVREGLLTVSDAQGRIVAETRCSPLPGSLLVAALPAGQARSTGYARTGPLLAWSRVIVASLCLLFALLPDRLRRLSAVNK